MEWPQSLVQEIASHRAIIFLGSGSSAGCSNAAGEYPPTWEKFLDAARIQFVNVAEDSALVQELILNKSFLDAAEIIFSYIDPAEADLFFRDVFQRPAFQPSKLHDIIHGIDSKIVITTNYDQIYEHLCLRGEGAEGYNVKSYCEDQILDEIRSPTRLIIKAHGCVTNPQKIVLTRSQYFNARMLHPSFYSLLDSLFLTHTVLFIGYSLSDPDIQLILENANIAVPSAHPHYALVQKEKHPAIVKAIRSSYNIRLLEYENEDGTHKEVIPSLEELFSRVNFERSLLLE